ncbi:MAG: hypothetical protein ABI771_02600 [Betaproteobacteria bacterium]
MAAKLLICVSSEQATVAIWRRRRLVSCNLFENDEKGWSGFRNFLEQAQGLPIHIIVDTVEEDFRFETLPHVRGRDRSEMVGRKLKQLYRATPYYSYALQERATGKRRDDRYLFAALTNPELLVPWLSAIEAAALPVSGIYPLALVSVTLIDRLKLKHPNLLVITKDAAGLRQTFFKNLKFRISRLTPLSGVAEQADEHYAEEIGNTRMYLDALTVTHVDDMLEIVVLDQNGSLAGLASAIMDGRPNVNCQYFGAADIRSRFGIADAILQSSVDVLHLHLLGEQAPALNLAPAHLTRTYQRFAAGRWVYAASAMLVLAAAIWSGLNIYQARDIDAKSAVVQQQTRDYQTKYLEVTAQFPETPTTAENLRRTVETAEHIQARARSPEPMFEVISHALDASPEILLQGLEWHYTDEPSGKADSKSAKSFQPDPANPVQIGVVKGEINRFAGDYRRAMETIQTFTQLIAQNNAVAEVKVTKLPLDVRSESGLNGSTTATPGKLTAQFEIAVYFKSGV